MTFTYTTLNNAHNSGDALPASIKVSDKIIISQNTIDGAGTIHFEGSITLHHRIGATTPIDAIYLAENVEITCTDYAHRIDARTIYLADGAKFTNCDAHAFHHSYYWDGSEYMQA